MNQKGISRWFQIALWGSRTKAQNERTVSAAEHHAEAVAHGEGHDDRHGAEHDHPPVPRRAAGRVEPAERREDRRAGVDDADVHVAERVGERLGRREGQEPPRRQRRARAVPRRRRIARGARSRPARLEQLGPRVATRGVDCKSSNTASTRGDRDETEAQRHEAARRRHAPRTRASEPVARHARSARPARSASSVSSARARVKQQRVDALLCARRRPCRSSRSVVSKKKGTKARSRASPTPTAKRFGRLSWPGARGRSIGSPMPRRWSSSK